MQNCGSCGLILGSTGTFRELEVAFLVDLLMMVFAVFYVRFNYRLYKWRLGVTQKYPWTSSGDKSFKDDMRGMWEFVVSILLLCGLLYCLLLAIYLQSLFGHASFQLVTLPCIIYWAYSFVSVGTYPRSHRLLRWLGKQGMKLINRPSV